MGALPSRRHPSNPGIRLEFSALLPSSSSEELGGSILRHRSRCWCRKMAATSSICDSSTLQGHRPGSRKPSPGPNVLRSPALPEPLPGRG